jgi:RNA polymerase sigma-70 factor (ECF subfamily)
MNNHSDNELVALYLSGDTKALDLLIKNYLKPVYNFVLRFTTDKNDANDIAQETFLKVWKYIKKFDQTKNFKTWLFAIARNTAIDMLRKKKSVSFSDAEIESEMIADTLIGDSGGDKNSEIRFDDQLEREKLDDAIEKIGPKDQAIIFLHYDEACSFQEIADILGESVNTIKSRHRRALITLKKHMTG